MFLTGCTVFPTSEFPQNQLFIHLFNTLVRLLRFFFPRFFILVFFYSLFTVEKISKFFKTIKHFTCLILLHESTYFEMIFFVLKLSAMQCVSVYSSKSFAVTKTMLLTRETLQRCNEIVCLARKLSSPQVFIQRIVLRCSNTSILSTLGI